ARLWSKKRLFGTGEKGAISILVGGKIPLSRSKEDLLTSGAVDFAASLLWTEDFGPVAFHASVGAILPGDVKVFEEDVDTRNALTFGLGAAVKFAEWGVLVAQVQGSQSVFEDSADSISIFDEMPMSAHGGGRFRIGSYVLEAGVGTGLTDQSADLILQFSLTLPL
ncbi:MAG TPA: DUF3187 family protein, partial [Planctomycetota bacterium]|nr:DUF3187 family protein [Planctomycetota bacterium]